MKVQRLLNIWNICCIQKELSLRKWKLTEKEDKLWMSFKITMDIPKTTVPSWDTPRSSAYLWLLWCLIYLWDTWPWGVGLTLWIWLILWNRFSCRIAFFWLNIGRGSWCYGKLLCQALLVSTRSSFILWKYSGVIE